MNKLQKQKGYCYEDNILFCLFIRAKKLSVIDAATHNIKQFACNCLLTALVELKIKLSQQLIGIVSCSLHGYHSGSMFTGIAVEQSCEDLKIKLFRYQSSKHSIQVWLNDEIIIQSLCRRFLLAFFCCLTLSEIFLCLCRSNIAG